MAIIAAILKFDSGNIWQTRRTPIQLKKHNYNTRIKRKLKTHTKTNMETHGKTNVKTHEKII